MSANVRVVALKWAAFIVGAILVLALGPRLTEAHSIASSNLNVTGGVLADRGEGWRVYNNGHASSGLAGVSCESNGRLVVTFDHVGSQVGFGSATVDEHLAQDGIVVGVSAGPDELRLFFYNRNGSQVSCRNTVFDDPLSNVWLIWAQPD